MAKGLANFGGKKAKPFRKGSKGGKGRKSSKRRC